jgi:hypothetical protein
MSPLETPITDKLLHLIRSKRAAPEVAVRTTSTCEKAIRRVAQFSDFEAVADLKRRHGLGDDSVENWERLWVRNPALRLWSEPPAIGCVLEAGSRIVGYMGSIPLAYQYGARTIRAVTTHALVVEQEYRALAVGIVTYFFRQPAVELFLNTTAVPAAAKLVMALGASPVPQRDYGRVLFWVLNRRRFIAAIGRKLSLNRAGRMVAGVIGPAAILAESLLRRRTPKRSGDSLEIKKLTIESLGTAFDALWQQRSQNDKLLLAYRDAQTLRWHFSGPRTKNNVTIIAAYAREGLVGYIALLSTRDPKDNLRRSVVADIFTATENPETVKALVAAAYREAKSSGDDVLEIVGFPASIRSACAEGNPYQRDFPACPFYFKTVDPELKSELASQTIWYASPYDGDGSLGS